ncbi:hypothetical protein Pr1d_53570 [Bythopirellula goksoeyrii]|uniref:PEP-CTERM protein-sorting domain-containing protein n=1 Tax=Bythopirellula goksoeyrii TaxID=1400387 RepID=A0A5B9QJ22_9BACT|nr:hypothetical protein Pr1d_53570 [Bythopirellula goksoeyrii]
MTFTRREFKNLYGNRSITKKLLVGVTVVVLPGFAFAAPVVYTDEALFLAELATIGGSTIHESFEDGLVWANSRNSIVSPGSAPDVISQGILWTSNYLLNNIATGTVGGSAPDGSYAIYSLPHGMTTDSGLYCDSAEDPDIPSECFQNDGLKVESATGATLYAFGGRIDTANNGKVTFLLDGVDINGNNTDNIDNWQREGDWADSWAFVGVIDTTGFLTAELRELRGKDFQQVLMFNDDFTIQTEGVLLLPGDFDDDGDVDGSDFLRWQHGESPTPLSSGDLADWQTYYGATTPPLPASFAVPEPSGMALLVGLAMFGARIRSRSRFFRIFNRFVSPFDWLGESL